MYFKITLSVFATKPLQASSSQNRFRRPRLKHTPRPKTYVSKK